MYHLKDKATGLKAPSAAQQPAMKQNETVCALHVTFPGLRIPTLSGRWHDFASTPQIDRNLRSGVNLLILWEWDYREARPAEEVRIPAA